MELEVGPELSKEPLEFLPLGPVESRWRSDLSVPSGRHDWGLWVASGLYVVQSLLNGLEYGDLYDQRGVALVQVLDRIVELSGLFYGDLLLLAVGVRRAVKGVGGVIVYSGLGRGQLLLKVNRGRHSSYTFVLNRDRSKGVKQRMTNYGCRVL